MYTLPHLPVSLPNAFIPDRVLLGAIAAAVESAFNDLKDSHFSKDAVWRDIFALTGTLRTFYTSSSVAGAWKATSRIYKPTSFHVEPNGHIIRMGNASWVEFPFTFETTATPKTSCSGFLDLVPSNDGWKIWRLRTILEGLHGVASVDFLEPVKQRPEIGCTDDEMMEGIDRANTLNEANHVTDGNGNREDNFTNVSGVHGLTEAIDSNLSFGCVVVGGGQAGLATGGRLQALGISYVILDKHKDVGDSWNARYDSTRLHTIREYSHLPFDRTFPSSYPDFLTGKDLGRGHRDWAFKYGINIWQSTTLLSGSWDTKKQLWTLKIERYGQETSLSCRFLVFAAGAGGQLPLIPTYKNREAFQGLILHSQEYKSASAWTGKHGVVVGTANTGHDVAEDMFHANLASVTMVQRSKTYVFPEHYYNDTQHGLYNENFPTELADRHHATNPIAVSRLLANKGLHGKARREPERFDALEKAGFKVERYGDIMFNLYERSGGHYMDVGASEKIARGFIKVKSDSLPVSYTKDGLLFSDGDHLKADVIVFATGFVKNQRLVVAEILGQEVADQLEDYWGLNEEGEIKGAFRPSGHPAFWYHGGTIGQARFFSRFIALQIKAKLLGTPLPVYKDTPPRNQIK
ncbi:flavin-containing monooxygenase [Viridothelium virens]|uniref:Flavin-containing monooxygenase n=1 Tax=Viridothelium virens TaxID=1048519 RepID=A0A6A6GT01_VIRVR|nr:flavin-containing monooxygenase [Viridothelium virens]